MLDITLFSSLVPILIHIPAVELKWINNCCFFSDMRTIIAFIPKLRLIFPNYTVDKITFACVWANECQLKLAIMQPLQFMNIIYSQLEFVI